MAKIGPRPKPTKLKILEGNPGKRPLNRNEISPESKAPECPDWLEDEAKAEWKRMSKQLEQLGVLTELDRAAFAGYCQSYARWLQAEAFMQQHGTMFKTPSGYVQQLPHVSIAQKYLKIMQSFCAEFGLTPASRVQISVDHDDINSMDPMEQILFFKPSIIGKSQDE